MVSLKLIKRQIIGERFNKEEILIKFAKLIASRNVGIQRSIRRSSVTTIVLFCFWKLPQFVLLNIYKSLTSSCK